MSGSCNIATAKNSFAINLTLPPSDNLRKSPLSNSVTSVENSAREIKPLSAQDGDRNSVVSGETSSHSNITADGQVTSSDRGAVEEASSSSSRTTDAGSASERINERSEVTAVRADFLSRPVQENAFNFLYASHSSKLSDESRVQLQNDENGKKAVIISELLGLESVSGNSWQQLLPQINQHGKAIFAEVEKDMIAHALEAWKERNPGEAIPNPLPFTYELGICQAQVRHGLEALANMSPGASEQAISGVVDNILAALTTICHTLIPRSPNEPAAANPGPDVAAGPAVDRGVSFGNIHNQQGDTIHNHYYGTQPGNENTSGRQSGTVDGEQTTMTEQTLPTPLPAGEHPEDASIANRAAMANNGNHTDLPEDVAQEPTPIGAQPLKPVGDDVLDANMEQPKLDDEQLIDSRSLAYTLHKEVKQAIKKSNVGVNGDLARVYAPAIARKIVSVKMQDVASVPQNANQPLFSRDLERTRQPGLEVKNPAEKNGFADLKGVKNLINAWENVAITEANGSEHHLGLPTESDSGYESTGDNRVSARDDNETVAFNSINDVDPRNALRRMSESSAAETGYDGDYSDDGDNSDYTSWNELHLAGGVQNGEIGSHRDENDSSFVNADKGSLLREKIALFNKGNGAKSEQGLNAPQNANRALFARNLRQVRQPGQEVNNPAEKNGFADLKGVKNLINAWENVAIKGANEPVNDNGQQVNDPAGKTSFADLKGVRNLINAWENVALEEANGSVHHHALSPETDAGYESIDDSRVSAMNDSKTTAFNSIDSHGDVVPANAPRRMSASSDADGGYSSEGDNISLASIDDLKHAPEVQVDETNHPGNKVDSLLVNAEKGSVVREKMALFSKGSEVKSQSTRTNFTWGVKGE